MINSQSKPKILLTNDDGINAPGLKALYDALKDLGECTVVAPLNECSATGHAITIHTPIRVQKLNHNFHGIGWALTGTPCDCVKYAIKEILQGLPDLLVAGINQGANTAINTIYSGTVAGAAEGAILNIPSFALSLWSYDYQDFSVSAEFARIMAKKILSSGLPEYTFLNINVPPVPKDQIAGVRITKQGKTRYEEMFERRLDPANNVYFWLKGERVLLEYSDDSDEIAVEKNYISITPLQCDLTNYQAMDILRSWNFSI
jgi:5'-nucleotidase